LPRRVAETLPVGMDCILGNLFELILVPQIRIGKKKSGFIESSYILYQITSARKRTYQC